MCLLIEDIWKGMAVDDAILTVVNIREKSILVTKLNPTEKACPAFEGGRGVVRHESLLAKVPVQQQIGTERGLPMPACLLMPARMPGGRTGGARARGQGRVARQSLSTRFDWPTQHKRSTFRESATLDR